LYCIKKKGSSCKLEPARAYSGETLPSFHCNPAAQSGEMLSQGGRGKLADIFNRAYMFRPPRYTYSLFVDITYNATNQE